MGGREKGGEGPGASRPVMPLVHHLHPQVKCAPGGGGKRGMAEEEKPGLPH